MKLNTMLISIRGMFLQTVERLPTPSRNIRQPTTLSRTQPPRRRLENSANNPSAYESDLHLPLACSHPVCKNLRVHFLYRRVCRCGMALPAKNANDRRGTLPSVELACGTSKRAAIQLRGFT